MNYANRKGIPFVVIAGQDEIQQNKVTVKNMVTGEQQLIPVDEIINYILEK
jgi:histidyl-tRNA synthetase